MILFLSLISYWRFQRLQKALPEIKLPKIELPDMGLDWQGDLFSEYLDKEEKKEWISSDGKLALTYPARWIAAGEDFLKNLVLAPVIQTKAEILFLAYRLETDWQTPATFLIVREISPEKSLEEIIKEMKREFEEEGGKAEFTIPEAEGSDVELEIILSYPAKDNFYLKGKLIFGKEKTYLVFCISSREDWSGLEQEIRDIFDSARLS